ncbi:hypothetical protein BJV78DRAFT_137107 [Lactifluus subvellereus]|nr:hypothetical protein BJV78DRAFT_137107 [Lactifluus subvellereus]
MGDMKQLSDIGAALLTLIVSIYTLRTWLYYSRLAHHHGPTDKEKERKQKLRRSLSVVACLWAALYLQVDNKRAIHFYGKTRHLLPSTQPCVLLLTLLLCGQLLYSTLYFCITSRLFHRMTDIWCMPLPRKPGPTNALFCCALSPTFSLMRSSRSLLG